MQADPIFTVSMAWDRPTERHGLGLNHGFLDDILITSFGVVRSSLTFFARKTNTVSQFDYGSGFIDVLARDVLTDHTLCEGTKPSTMW